VPPLRQQATLGAFVFALGQDPGDPDGLGGEPLGGLDARVQLSTPIEVRSSAAETA